MDSSAEVGGQPSASFDTVHYEREVVRPLRAHPKRLPADLRVRYAIDPALSDIQLKSHLELLVQHWSERSQEKTWTGAVYRSLVDAHHSLVARPGVDLISQAWWLSYRPPTEEADPSSQPVPPPGPDRSPARDTSTRPEADEWPPDGRAPPETNTATRTRTEQSVGQPASAPAPVSALHTIRQLRARRTAGHVALSWIWPEGSTQVEISWQGQRKRITRQQYRVEGGFHATIEANATEFAVAALWFTDRGLTDRALADRALTDQGLADRELGDRRFGDEELGAGRYLRSDEVRILVPEQLQEVRYYLRPVRHGLRSVHYTAEFRTDRPPVHCEIDVMLSRLPNLPYSPEGCERIETAYIRFEQTSVTFELPRRSGATWLRCFVRGSPPIVLIDPPVTELRIRSWGR